MERKIGEIFEYNGEWYQCVEQCVEHEGCHGCAFDISYGIRCSFNGVPHCSAYRSDGKPVIFKKLEKVGEPFSDECFGLVQKYKLKMYCYSTKDKRVCFVDSYDVFIKTKQNKEDMDDLDKIKVKDYMKVKELNVMEEKKLNLKPFDIQKAREGKPVCTKDGRKARIICFDSNGGRPIVALVTECDDEEEIPYKYHCDGSYNCQSIPSDNDLMMLPEKKEGWVNVYKRENEYICENECNVFTGIAVYKSEGEAKRNINKNEIYVNTIKINWSE